MLKYLGRLLQKPKTSLYDRLGPDAVDAAVDALYRKILADNRISRFFEDTDLDRLRHKQKMFVRMALGGPKNPDIDLGKCHTPLLKFGLSDQHFDWVLAHLENVLRDLRVAEEDIAAAIQGLEGTRSEVLGRL
ncbi:MAG TPA: group 1 truncated hemoglobin [Methylocella sp.]|nr:group 1 truncated hemoglobin [Methylocella sp.]